MNFSMNGFRRSLSADVSHLRDVAKDIIDGNHYDDEDLIDAVNDLICSSNGLNCVYIKDNPDFVQMEDLEVEHLEP